MRILLSAYACEPNRGSEPGVGWNWAIELANLNHEVWVLTRKNNKEVIDTFFENIPLKDNLNFIYFDLPSWAREWKKGGRGVWLYYLLWQIGAYWLAKKHHQKEKFEQVHHVTFVGVRQPSFMGNLKIPFIFGPVAGGEHAPWKLRFGYSLRGWILDAIRDGMNFIVKFDPFMWLTFFQANEIYVTSEQTKNIIPQTFHKKTKIQLAIGYYSEQSKRLKREVNNSTFRILFVGTFIYLKGMHLGIPALAKLIQKKPNVYLTMISGGPDRKRWENLAIKLKINENIEWIDRVEQSKLSDYYNSHDVFLFPSLHDSGGMVVLEAMAHQLPVVCLDLGGPGLIVNECNGVVIPTGKQSEDNVINKLADALYLLQSNTELRSQLGENALKTSTQYSWSALVKKLYKIDDK